MTEKQPRRGRLNSLHRVTVERGQEAEKLLILGLPHAAVVSHLADKYFISHGAARRIIDSVYTAWAKIPRIDRDALRNKMREQMLNLYQRCFAEKDFKTAVNILDKLCRLDGLYMPEVSEVNVNSNVPATDPTELRARIRALLSKHPEFLAQPESLALATVPLAEPLEPPKDPDDGSSGSN